MNLHKGLNKAPLVIVWISPGQRRCAGVNAPHCNSASFRDDDSLLIVATTNDICDIFRAHNDSR